MLFDYIRRKSNMKTTTKCACMANGAVLKQPGKDAKIIKGKEF